MAATLATRFFILAAAVPVLFALPYCSLLEIRAVTVITTSDTRFSIGTYTAHGLYQAPTAALPQPSAATPFGECEKIGKRTAPAPDFTAALEIHPGGWRGTWPALGSVLEMPASGRNTPPPTRDRSDNPPPGMGLGPVHGIRGGSDAIQPPGKRPQSPEGPAVSHTPELSPRAQRGGSPAKAPSAVTPPIEESGLSNTKATDPQYAGGPTVPISPSESLTAAPAIATTVRPAAVWSPQVITTSLALIPVILAITVICCLILFMILHCCTPREITHVTNNTYTTKVVRRNPRDAKKPRPEPARGPPGGHAAALALARPACEDEAAIISQDDGILDPSPSSGLYLPRQHGLAFPSTPPQAATAGNWHRGLLGFGSRKPPFIQSPSLLHPFAQPSLLGVETSYVLSQASRRLEDEARSHRLHRHHPLSAVSASLPSGGPGPQAQPPSLPSMEGEWEQSPHLPPPQAERRSSLTSELQDTGCGTHTLRNRRKGMRDTWLSNLFVEKAPGTENLVILEQRDGALRGASVGAAVELESMQAISEASSTPRRPFHETPEKPLRRRAPKLTRSNGGRPQADADVTRAKGNYTQEAEAEEEKEKPNPKPHTVPRAKSVQRYSREINLENAGPVSAEAILGRPAISGLGSGGLWVRAGLEICTGKENITNEQQVPTPPVSRRTTFEEAAMADALRMVKEEQEETRPEPDLAVVPLAPPNNPDGPTDLMAFQARAQLADEEIDRQLQDAVDDQIEQDELSLRMVASLDGVVNTPPAMASGVDTSLLAPGWLLNPHDGGPLGSVRVDSVLASRGTDGGGADDEGGHLSGSSQTPSAAGTGGVEETFMDERVSTTAIGVVQSIG